MAKILNSNAEHVKKKKTDERSLLSWLVCLIVVSLVFSGVSLATYVTSSSGSDQTKIAKFVIESSTDSEISTVLTFDCNDDDMPSQRSYPFIIKNSSDDKGISDVAIRYDIVVTLPEAPLPDGVTMELQTADGSTRTATISENIYTFASAGTFSPGSSAEHAWKLIFTVDHDMVEEDIQITGINISVNAEQID